MSCYGMATAQAGHTLVIAILWRHKSHTVSISSLPFIHICCVVYIHMYLLFV